MVDSPTRQGNGAAGEQVAPLPIFYRRPRPLNSEVDRGKSLRLAHRHGDLLVMGGSCQRTWEHSIPKTTRPVGPRISIQFRPHDVR